MARDDVAVAQGGMKMLDEQAQRPKFELPANFKSIVQMLPKAELSPVQELFKTAVATGANSEAVQAQFEQRFSASAGKLRETYGAESVAAFVEKGMSFYEERGERAKEVGEPILAETPAHAAIEHRLEEADARVEPKKVKKPRGKETPAPAAQKAPEPALPAMPTKQEEAVAFAQRVVPVISELKLNFGSVEEKTGFLSFAKEKIELIEESTPLLEGKKLESVLAGLYNTWKRESKGEGTSVAMK